MNKFKKPYSSRASASRPDSRSSARPASRSRFGASAARTGAPAFRSTSARPYSAGSRDARPARGEAFQKFDAVCSNCGKKCQVPFRPDGTKPVYCKDCFGIPRDAMSSKKKSFAIAPARGSSPFRGTMNAAPEGKSIADLTRQIAAMNTKIDTMLKILADDASEE